MHPAVPKCAAASCLPLVLLLACMLAACAKRRNGTEELPRPADTGTTSAGRAAEDADVIRARDAAPSERDATTPATDASIPAKVTSYADFCQQKVEHYCRGLAGCCGLDASKLEFCARYQRWDIVSARQVSCASTVEPMGFAIESAQACLEASLQRYDGCYLVRPDTAQQRNNEQACARVAPVAGPKPGERCNGSDVCMGPAGTYSECMYGSDGYPSLCGQPRPLAKLGESCSQVPCIEGLSCSRRRVCSAPLADGSECSSDLDCISRACSIVPDAMQGVCAAPGPAFDAKTCAEWAGLSRYALYAESISRPQFTSREIVWWTARALFRAPKDGSGPVTELPGKLGSLLLHAVDDDHVFGLELGGRQLIIMSLKDGSSEQLVLTFKADAVAVDANQIYAASADCSTLTRISKMDHASVQLRAQLPAAPATGAVDRAQLEVDATGAYCANRFAVFRYPTEGTSDGARLANLREQDAGFFAERLSVGEQQLWLFLGTLDGRSRVLRLDKTGPVPTKPVDAALDLSILRVLDRARNRWLDSTDDGITSVSIDDGSREHIPAAPMIAGTFLTVDADFVYWSYGHAILRRPIPR